MTTTRAWACDRCTWFQAGEIATIAVNPSKFCDDGEDCRAYPVLVCPEKEAVPLIAPARVGEGVNAGLMIPHVMEAE